MHNLETFNNGLTLITIPMPHLESVTTLVSVGGGSRYEDKKINGISHFLEHMFFKGSRKYPTAEIISTLVDGIGAVNNAATSKEYTFYWIKSSSRHLNTAMDILSSQLKESLMAEEEVEREKGVIVEELRMYRDNPGRYVWDLYERLQFGNQPLGWDIGGEEKTVNSLKRQDFVNYMDSLYSPKNMALVLAGNLPKDINQQAESYFGDLPKRSKREFAPYKKVKQTGPKVDLYYKKTDQTNLILGVESFDRDDPRKYATKVLATILGEGMSSRLFIQVRERRGLAYHVNASFEPYMDSGAFAVFAGLKLEKTMEGLEVIKSELGRIASADVTEDELSKAKEMFRGRLAIRGESTNFLAEYFGTNFVLDREIETFDHLQKKVESVSVKDVREVASELFKAEKYNLQVIGPFKDKKPFEGILVG